MSGHNKWSKIKHKKSATDAKKSKIFSKHARLLAVESRKANGDVRAPNLRAAIERARADSMPNENIARAVAKGGGPNPEELHEVTYEFFGPGGIAFLATALTTNTTRTSQEIKHLLSTLGYTLGTPGSALWAFKKSGSGWLPQTPMDISEEDGALVAELVDALEEHDDIQDVFSTADEVS